MERRVVVTGMGLVTPLGIGLEPSWNGVVNGRSGIKKINNFSEADLPCKIAGLVEDFDLEPYVPARDIKRMAKFIRYGLVATQEAVLDAGIDSLDEEVRSKVGVYMGSGIGGLDNIENTMRDLLAGGRISPFFIPSTLVNLFAGQAAIKHGFMGPNLAFATACTTGTHCLGEATRAIIQGDSDIIVAGSAESSITPLGIGGFCACRALTTAFNDEPERASRPWDTKRSGFVMSEGAGVLVLEEYEHAKARGANIYAELLGYGTSGDAYHMTSPHPNGLGATMCMEKALKKARLNPEQIDYINAHSTSTTLGDEIELATVQKLFFEKNSKVVMSSTKSSVGHTLGAAGSIEAAFSILALQNQVAPPTINLENPVPEARMNLAANVAYETKINYVLSNSFGFGGTNATIIFGRV
jgi:3-oxoacyl-[acyl-carrier-protein] synthase II